MNKLRVWSKMIRKIIMNFAVVTMVISLSPFLIAARFWSFADKRRPRLFLGATPILSLALIARALRQAGHEIIAGAVADVDFPRPEGFDLWVKNTASPNIFVRRGLGTLEAMMAFVRLLFRADVYVLYFDGGLLRRTPLQKYEIRLLKLAGKKVVMFPYGSDAFVIDRIAHKPWREMLTADYPQFLARARDIEARLARFANDADLLVGCLFHISTLPRWDHLMLVCYPVETHEIEPVFPDPSDEVIRVFHAPNHRIIKGTKHIIEAVRELRDEGIAIELDLVERVSRHEVLKRMSKAHVLADQLNAGYAQTALEGMALGKIVITGANPPEHDKLFLDKTALGECPVHWASTDTIKQVLREIADNRSKWHEWGVANRRFVERHHSFEATARNWQKVFDQLPRTR